MSATVDPGVIEQAGAALRRSVETLNACIDKIVDSIQADEHYDQDAVIHLAWLTHQVIGIVAELKALDQVSARPEGRRGGSLADRFR